MRDASGAKPPATLIVLQYRPPVDAMCVEFPAGMVDEGETSEKAALRELREETGYEGRVGAEGGGVGRWGIAAGTDGCANAGNRV